MVLNLTFLHGYVASLSNHAQVVGTVARTLQSSADSKVLATALLVLRDLHLRSDGCLTSEALLPGLVNGLLSCADSSSIEVELATLKLMSLVCQMQLLALASGSHKAPFNNI